MSKHLCIPISEVIYRRDDLDIIMLLRKYGQEVRVEQERIKEANKEARKRKSRRR